MEPIELMCMDFLVWFVMVLCLRELQNSIQFDVNEMLKAIRIQHISQLGVVILIQKCILVLALITPFVV